MPKKPNKLKPIRKIVLKPELKLELHYEIRADSKAEAESAAQAHVIRQIAAAFGIDPSNCNIKFGD